MDFMVFSQTSTTLNAHIYATPHSGEAATLVGCTAQIENDRIAAIHQLATKICRSMGA